MKNILFTCLVVLLLSGCNHYKKKTNPTIQKIAFGSCNKQNFDQSFWPTISAQNPDLWVWLGDNIYADTSDMDIMYKKYQLQKNNPYYQNFIQDVPVTGIWDDHDYGMNDGNRTFAKRDQAEDQFFNFLDIPEDNQVHQYPGIYRTETFGHPPQQIKIFHLDTRFFQDPLVKTPKGSEKNYVAQPNGQVLGEAQWDWLTNELNQSNANINIIASSIQVIAEDHRFEMWSNFPNQRKKLLDLIVSSEVKNPIILSGDRHLSEISKINWQGQELIDITSSGMTHSYTTGKQEFNRHRVQNLITIESFATMTFDWNNNKTVIQQLDMQGKVINSFELNID